MKIRVRNLTLEICLTFLGYIVNLDVIPLRWARPAWRGPRDSPFGTGGWHIYLGPLHIWGGGGFSAILSLEVKIGQNPFHGGALSPRRPR